MADARPDQSLDGPQRTKQLEILLEALPDDTLDELVHDVAQDVSLGRLNEADTATEQEEMIAAAENAASEVNNAGPSSQLSFLLANGVTPDHIEQVVRSRTKASKKRSP